MSRPKHMSKLNKKYLVALCLPLALLGARKNHFETLPNLGIVDDAVLHRKPLIPSEIRIRNLSPVAGNGSVQLYLRNASGKEQARSKPKMVWIPPRAEGGEAGRRVDFSNDTVFQHTFDSLLTTLEQFTLTATVTTAGGDADETDNIRTREWSKWAPMEPASQFKFVYGFTVPDSIAFADVKLFQAGFPVDISVDSAYSKGPHGMGPGVHELRIDARAPRRMSEGSIVAERLSLEDPATHRVLNSQVRYAAYDTTPPTISSFRILVLDDGRIAVQLYASDLETFLPENGVETLFSTDNGKTWSRRVHKYFYDDFGQPATFESVIGPFPSGTDVLLGVSAQDIMGNRRSALLDDGEMFVATLHAGNVFDAFARTRNLPNPLFALESTHRELVVARAMRDSIRMHPGFGTRPSINRFEDNRVIDYLHFSEPFQIWDVDPVAFLDRAFEALPFTVDGIGLITAARVRVR